jgi:hypothetical protein
MAQSDTKRTVTGTGGVTARALFALVALALMWPAAEAAGAAEDDGSPPPEANGESLEAPPTTLLPELAPEPDDPAPAEVPPAEVVAPPEEVVAPPEELVPAEPPAEEVVAPPEAVVPVVEPPAEEVVAPPAPAGAAVLDVTPESSSSLTGSDHVLTAAVTDAAGNGVPGAAVDFEVVTGPADGDVGTPGDTPLSPDLECVAAGGGPGVAATCTVAYAENGNQQGRDRVLAWIDHDGDNATVEADVAEGRYVSACVAEHGNPGQTPEPDGTDCVTHDWTRRVTSAVDVTTDLAANVPGVSHQLEAVIVDQGGEVLDGVDTRTTVRFYFLDGSAHDPSPRMTLSRPDFACQTDATGSCTVDYPGTVRGVDTLCAVIPGGGNQCGEPVDAPDSDNQADVVAVAWVGGRLDVDKESSPSLSGTEHVLTARIVDGAGVAMVGMEVDFEVVAGPGDDDVGDDGDSPESPDLGCVTAAGESDAGTCRVAYTDDGNEGGIDAVLAWVDIDHSDATVEADRAEGESGDGRGQSGCAAGSSGIGTIAEPDDTDCVTRIWSARVATSVDVSPEAARLSPGGAHRLDVVVLDQEGVPIVAPTEVQFSFLHGSVNSSEHLTCTTSSDGSCSVTWSGRVAGTDTVCGALPGAISGCGESTDAVERADAADVVSVTWAGPNPAQPVDGAADGASSGGASGGGASLDDASLDTRRGGAPGSGQGALPGATAEDTRSAPERFAEELVKHAPFPIALMVVIGMFLWFQHRFDRNDPKLFGAAVEAEFRRFE